MNIDLDRGVTMRKHPGGFLVSMYKDQPGTYLFEDGSACAEQVAAEAGFDVEAHDKARRKTELMAAYKQKLDSMMAQELKKLEEQIERELQEPVSMTASESAKEDATEEKYQDEDETVQAKRGSGRPWGRKKEAST